MEGALKRVRRRLRFSRGWPRTLSAAYGIGCRGVSCLVPREIIINYETWDQ